MSHNSDSDCCSYVKNKTKYPTFVVGDQITKILSPTSTLTKSISREGLKKRKAALKDFRVTILGDRDVGKTALVVRFITRRYIGDYDKGSDSFYKHEMIIDQDTVMFDILDSSSPFTLNIRFFDFSSHIADIFLIVYSITDRQSFIYVRNLLNHFAQLKEIGQTIPFIAVVGNKSDLIHMRQVSSEEGKILGTEFNKLILAYLGEISVADGYAQQLFADMYRWMKKQRLTLPTTTSSNGGDTSSSSSTAITTTVTSTKTPTLIITYHDPPHSGKASPIFFI